MKLLKTTFFSLVELLITCSILAIISSLLIPSLKKAYEAGLATACKNNLKQVLLASELYLNDNENIMVPSSSSGSFEHQSWVWSLSYYFDGWQPKRRTTVAPSKSENILLCPSIEDPFGDRYNTISTTQSTYSYNLYSGDTHFRGRLRSPMVSF